MPSVVNISTLTTLKGGLGAGNSDELFRKFFDELFNKGGGGGGVGDGGGAGTQRHEAHRPPEAKALALGSGFIIDDRGTILTNNHVVADADEIRITFTEEPDETPVEGRVVGRDPELDVALIRVKDKDKARRKWAPVALGDSDHMLIGDYVMAIGNPFGQGHSVTHGILSQKGRAAPDLPLATYLQTDAPINPGNSGGPLMNLKGEVIGINNAIEVGAHGIGFAIPINVVKAILPQLESKGVVTRGFIGVAVNNLNPPIAKRLGVAEDLHAPFVVSITPDSPADRGGLKPFDVITSFDGKQVRTGNELVGVVSSAEVGRRVAVDIKRDGHDDHLTIKLGRRQTEKVAKTELGENEAPVHPHARTRQDGSPDPGMTLETLTRDLASDMGMPKPTPGVVVSSVEPGGPASRAGLEAGDVILDLDRHPVHDVKAFNSVAHQPKDYLMRVRRPGSEGAEDVYFATILDLK